jgi:hypothetical protein
VSSNSLCGKRLTATGAVTEDTEKTVVSLYSKVKQDNRSPGPDRRNVTL